MLHENLDHSCRISDIVVRIQFELFEFGILSHEILDRVFEPGNDRFQLLFSGRGLDVKDNFVIDSELAGDRQGIVRGASMRVMINRDFGHGGR